MLKPNFGFKITLAVFIFSLILTGCAKKSEEFYKPGASGYGPNAEKNTEAKKGEISDVCKFFDADFVYSATGKPIVKVEPSPIPALSLQHCQYYTEYKDDFYKLPDGKVMPGGPWISIHYESNLDVEKQKEGNKFLGRTLKTDPRIKMDHFLSIQEDGLINEIYLVMGPSKFISINRSSGQILSEEEDILFAAKVAEKIQGNLSFEIKKNPATLIEEKKVDTTPTQQDAVKQFINYLSDKKFDEALNMMDANDQTKQMWKTNFNTIKSLKVESVEPYWLEEWTADRQMYKFILDVSVTPEGEQIGWENGKNFRWVTMQNNNGVWQVHELANNP